MDIWDSQTSCGAEEARPKKGYCKCIVFINKNNECTVSDRMMLILRVGDLRTRKRLKGGGVRLCKCPVS
jgi:hypothetical protein